MDLAITIAAWAFALILGIAAIIMVALAASMLYHFIQDLFNGRL